MRDRESTVRSRELGDALREAMERSGLSRADVARKLAWSQARVSRLLSGKRGTGETSIAAFMAVVGLTGKEFDRLLELSREMGKPGWLQPFSTSATKQTRTLVGHEQAATEIFDFQPTLVSGLLQIPAYTRAIMRASPNVRPDQVEERVSVRMARQSILSRWPQIKFTFFIHEFVLRLAVGGPVVMSEQLHHLLRLSVRPSISLRIVPAALGAHPAMSGPFKLMEFADARPVAYVEGETAGLFLEDRVDTDPYRNMLSALAASAMDQEESKEVIAMLATELYSDGGDRDDLEEEQL